jgi:hypothetical protein
MKTTFSPVMGIKAPFEDVAGVAVVAGRQLWPFGEAFVRGGEGRPSTLQAEFKRTRIKVPASILRHRIIISIVSIRKSHQYLHLVYCPNLQEGHG